MMCNQCLYSQLKRDAVADGNALITKVRSGYREIVIYIVPKDVADDWDKLQRWKGEHGWDWSLNGINQHCECTNDHI